MVVRRWRLTGSVYPHRNPVDLLIGAAAIIAEAGKDAVVVSFELREMPVVRQMALAFSELAEFESAIVPEGSSFLHEPWLVDAQPVPLQESLPESARTAQRRARWLEMLEGCEEHTLGLERTCPLALIVRIEHEVHVDVAVARVAE